MVGWLTEIKILYCEGRGLLEDEEVVAPCANATAAAIVDVAVEGAVEEATVRDIVCEDTECINGANTTMVDSNATIGYMIADEIFVLSMRNDKAYAKEIWVYMYRRISTYWSRLDDQTHDCVGSEIEMWCLLTTSMMAVKRID